MGFIKKFFNAAEGENQEVKDQYSSLNASKAVNTIKVLGISMIKTANSGHPGIVLGAAPIAYSLFRNFISADPSEPNFLNRDRFVLSAGHGSALLYATMHLAGYSDLSIDELKRFRQVGSKTPGHPESHITKGIDATTGPLGQGIGNAVGMAIAESFLNAKYSSGDIKPFNHYTYCLFGDGCLQEGVSYEAISLAGRLRLNKLIMIYDSNNVQLDGNVSDSTNMNTKN